MESRDSLSSVSTSNDYNEGSDYCTPETSGVATPASTKGAILPSNTTRLTETSLLHSIKTGISRRRRTQTADPIQSTSASNSIAQARALQNSMYSLNPMKKRKYVGSGDEDMDEDMTDDNTPDAQLARALQAQEDAASKPVVTNSSPGLRRTSRNVQPSKLSFSAAFSSEDEDDYIPVRTSRSAKKAKMEPKVELPSTSNAVNFKSSNRGKAIIKDSDDDDYFIKIDSDSDSDVPIAQSSANRSSIKKERRISQIIQKQSRNFQDRLKASASKNSIKKEAESSIPKLKTEDTRESNASSALSDLPSPMSDVTPFDTEDDSMLGTDTSDDEGPIAAGAPSLRNARHVINVLEERSGRRARKERQRLETHHPELHTMWKELEDLPKIGDCKIDQPTNINRELKPFQLQGVGWMRAMEKTAWGGGLLGDEMGMGKTIQAVSLIMSDFPAKQPSLVLIPPVALMQWQQEIADYTDGTLKTFVYHGSNAKSKGITVAQLKKYNVILMSYNSLESMYRKQEKGFKRKDGIHKERSAIHQIQFHRVILDEAHSIKVRYNSVRGLPFTNHLLATNFWVC